MRIHMCNRVLLFNSNGFDYIIQSDLLTMWLGSDEGVLCENIFVLFIDADSYQLIIINSYSVFYSKKSKYIILQVMVRIHVNYCNPLL